MQAITSTNDDPVYWYEHVNTPESTKFVYILFVAEEIGT